MKVLLDHNIPHELRSLFPEAHDVYTAQYLGWADYEDDELLQAAEEASVSVFVTLDRNLPNQQALHKYDVGIIILAVHPTTPVHLTRQMDRVLGSLPQAASGEMIVLD
jgi:predicted nuclease of predicted toxin-antitoxin system